MIETFGINISVDVAEFLADQVYEMFDEADGTDVVYLQFLRDAYTQLRCAEDVSHMDERIKELKEGG